MGKKLSIVDKFFIDNHKGKMSSAEMARHIGCHHRTIYNYIHKGDGGRTKQEREISQGNIPAPAPDAPPEPEPPTPLQKPISEAGGSELIAKKKHGESHAVAMTKEASEVADEVHKMGTQKPNPKYVYLINPDRE